VLGDMLELGPEAPALHRALLQPIAEAEVDLVFCAGPLMRALWEALPSDRRGEYAPSASALESKVLAAIQDGDAVMVKGSLGSRMGPIAKALTATFTRHAVHEAAAAQG
jgi:UDP-N-acetylmuramoyl-tripeptide--D-alanyl-D-alanine ligase